VIAEVNSATVALPSEPGMYVSTGNGFMKIIGQIAEFTRTGSRLVSHATIGIKSAKTNIQLPGPHAQTIVSPEPMFYFVPPKQEAAAGVNAGDLILIRLEEKSQRRQFEIGAAGLFRASSGISLTHQIQILRSEAAPGIYAITPAIELTKGEYALYLARGEGMAAYVYDFGVRGASAVRALQMSRPDSAIAFSKPALHQTATSSNETVDGGGVREQEKTPDSTVSDQEKPAAARPNSEYVHGAVLGVTVADWEQGGFKGVEVLEVANESSGYMAGLRKGNVITHVNGAHINSAEDLDGILSRLEPGSKISIGYMFKSNLGWMPVQAVAILGRGN
jgi:hypothetical protein